MKTQSLTTGIITLCLFLGVINYTISQQIQLVPPTNLNVDTISSTATWCKPYDTANNKVPKLRGYLVLLDDTLFAMAVDTFFTFPYLIYNTSYKVSITAKYFIGNSDTIHCNFTSGFLIPPRNLEGEPFDNSAHLEWDPPIHPTYSAPPVAPESISFPSTVHSLLPAPEITEPANIEPLFVNTHGSNRRDEGPIGWMNDVMTDLWMTIDVTTYGTTTIAAVSFKCFAGDFPKNYDNIMFACNYNYGETLTEIDVNTGTYTTIASMPCPLTGSGGLWTGFACDKATGIMYAMCTDISQSMLCIINTGTGEVTQIGPTTTAPGVIDCAFNAETSTMFAWDIVNDACYTIDVATGEATLLGPLGADLNYAQGGSWNPWDDEVYLTAYTTGGEFRILDQATGATTFLTALSSEMDCFGFPGSVGGGWNIPENLLAYRIYRNGDSIGQVDHPTYEYYDFDLWPGIYNYTITSIYDLSIYGYPGQHGESMFDGPVTIIGPYWWYLPFYEGWEFGCFEANCWEHEDCENWFVGHVAGNPAPCAVFHWDSVLTDYSCRIISYAMDGHEVIDGEIGLDFDIKLDDNLATGTEFLSVYLSNHEDSIFHVYEYSNTGSFDWKSQKFNITEFAKGEFFSVVFEAYGDYSSNILNWFVDNIHIYRICKPPINLTSVLTGINNDSIKLSWDLPDTNHVLPLSYNDGTFEDGIASNDGGEGLGQLFDMNDFPEIEYPFTITGLRYFNYSQTSYKTEKVYLLSGDGSTILAGPYTKISWSSSTWNHIYIDPVTITSGDFMIVTINTMPGSPKIGIDNSTYNGSLFYGKPGYWRPILSLGNYYCVGSHEAFIKTAKGNKLLSYYSPVMNGEDNHNPPYKKIEEIMDRPGGSRNLLGFNIFRSINLGDWQIINESLVSSLEYYDTNLTFPGLYCYYTTSVYDQCESDSSGNACVDIYTGRTDDEYPGIRVFPNPLSSQTTFAFYLIEPDHIEIDIFDQTGNLIEKVDAGFRQAGTTQVIWYPTQKISGIYIYTIRMNNQSINGKLIIQK